MIIGIFILIGVISGGLAGLLGTGGGVIVVPALAWVFHYFHLIPAAQVMQMAVGTSLSTVVITFMASLYSHHKQRAVRWDFVRLLLTGLILGVLVGALIAHDIPSSWLSLFFAIFLLAVALHIILTKNSESNAPAPARLFVYGVPVIIGMLTSILGIGGGVLLVPFLLRCRLAMRTATGTSVACGMAMALVGTFLYILLGRTAVDLPWSTGYIYWPAFAGVALASAIVAPLGTLLAYRLPVTFLKRLLAIFMVIVAIKMLLSH